MHTLGHIYIDLVHLILNTYISSIIFTSDAQHALAFVPVSPGPSLLTEGTSTYVRKM